MFKHKSAKAHLGQMPFLRLPQSGSICSVGTDDDDEFGGGGGDPPEKTLTTSEVQALMAKQERKLKAKFADYDDLKAKADKVDELAERVQEMQDQAELKDKSSADQAKILADRARGQAEKEINELRSQLEALTSERDGAIGNLRTHVMRGHATEALAKAGVLQGATRHAIRAFLEEAQIDLDDDRNIAGVEYGGVPQKDIASAAIAFLNDNEIFKAAKPGGGGTRAPNSGGLTTDDLDNMSGGELAAAGWNQQVSGARRGKDPVERALDND